MVLQAMGTPPPGRGPLRLPREGVPLDPQRAERGLVLISQNSPCGRILFSRNSDTVLRQRGPLEAPPGRHGVHPPSQTQDCTPPQAGHGLSNGERPPWETPSWGAVNPAHWVRGLTLSPAAPHHRVPTSVTLAPSTSIHPGESACSKLLRRESHSLFSWAG